MRIISILFVSLMFYGCCDGNQNNKSQLLKWEDKENNVICYNLKWNSKLSCVKVKDSK